MFISLGELKVHRVSFSKTYPEGAVDYHTPDFEQSGDLKVGGVAELGGEEIRVRGHIKGKVRAACDRCLSKVELPVEAEFDLTYRPMSEISREEEVEVPADELEVGFYSGDGIDLADVVAEQVTLFMPMQVVCRSDCKGLCPVCRKNLNLGRCDCDVRPPDESPFASLLEN